jgi:peptidoglycan/xylan/chitin deacetylase (PgdA/CDA1 family)
MWDILSHDYDKRLNTSRALRRIVSLSREGSIVVFHDSQKAKNQLEILLPQYLQQLSDRGYRFELIPTKKIQ